jgi:predicted nucleotidyltransferase
MGVLDSALLAKKVACDHPAVALLILFGSRARGEQRESSDWDFGYISVPGARLDVEQLLADLVTATGCDRIDLVDLSRAGALLRLRAAQDGVPILERSPGAFEEFALEASSFWCDAEPVLRRAYEALLAEAGR